MASGEVPGLVSSAGSSSSSSQGLNEPVTPGAQNLRRVNKLRKQLPGQSSFSFVADSPPAFSHFPYTFSAPSSPTTTIKYASTITSSNSLIRPETGPKRTTSMPTRKLTKQKPPPSSYHLAVREEPPPDLPKRRATLSFSFRRRKSERPLPPLPVEQADPPPLPTRRTNFTIGANDSDEDDEDHTNEQILIQEQHRSHHQSLPSHDPSTPSYSYPFINRGHADMSDTFVCHRHTAFDETELKRRRRWTLMTDEDITDHDFAETVLTRTQCTSLDGHEYDEYAYDDLGLMKSPTMDFDSVKRSTLLALLTTRDILRTERHYLSQIHIIVHSTISTAQWPPHPSPAVMHDRLISLIQASQSLLLGMEADPSVNGVAGTFVRLEGDVSEALGSWCAVVGQWFDVERRRKLGRTRRSVSVKTLPTYFATSAPPPPPLSPFTRPSSPLRAATEPQPEPSSPLRSKSAWRKSLPHLPVLGSSPRSVTLSKPASTQPRHTIQDLGILPVQRVTRYVLFFRDLLKHTDLGSPSRRLVEDAVDASMRIAKRCDDAQAHKRFLRL